MAAQLAILENEVAQFVAAVQHANACLAQLKSDPLPMQTQPVDTPAPNDLTAQIHQAIEAQDATREQAEKRVAFETMRTEWLSWGKGVMKTLEAWMGRMDLPIAERVRAMGLADRLAWYGVEANVSG